MTEPLEHSQGELHRKDYADQASGPMQDVRVLDLSRLFAGNVLTQILGDFGAEIIKVEPPAGDTLRGWKTKGVATHWKIYARNKKSLCLDLRQERAKALFRNLVPSADILVESFRPGVLERMGLGPGVLHELNPRLVIVRISGWGQDGPYSHRPGFGTVIEGMSGFAAINGFDDRAPVLPPMYLADGVAGTYGASAALVALRHAQSEGGKGQVIDLPLYDPLLALLGPQAANYRLSQTIRRREGSRSTNSAPRNVYRCKDGNYVSLSGSTQTMAMRILNAIGRSDLAADPHFATNAERLENVEALDTIIGDWMARYTQAEVVAHMEAAEVTVGPIYDVSQILSDPHVIEREILADYPDDDLGQLPMHHVSPRLSETPGNIHMPSPRLGQHNREILSTLNLTEDEIDGLYNEGVLLSEGDAA